MYERICDKSIGGPLTDHRIFQLSHEYLLLISTNTIFNLILEYFNTLVFTYVLLVNVKEQQEMLAAASFQHYAYNGSG